MGRVGHEVDIDLGILSRLQRGGLTCTLRRFRRPDGCRILTVLPRVASDADNDQQDEYYNLLFV